MPGALGTGMVLDLERVFLATGTRRAVGSRFQVSWALGCARLGRTRPGNANQSTAVALLQKYALRIQHDSRPRGTRDEAGEVFQHGRRVHQRSGRPIGGWGRAGARAARASSGPEPSRQLEGGAGVGVDRVGPTEGLSYYLSKNSFVPSSAHEVFGNEDGEWS